MKKLELYLIIGVVISCVISYIIQDKENKDLEESLKDIKSRL